MKRPATLDPWARAFKCLFCNCFVFCFRFIQPIILWIITFLNCLTLALPTVFGSRVSNVPWGLHHPNSLAYNFVDWASLAVCGPPELGDLFLHVLWTQIERGACTVRGRRETQSSSIFQMRIAETSKKFRCTQTNRVIVPICWTKFSAFILTSSNHNLRHVRNFKMPLSRK